MIKIYLLSSNGSIKVLAFSPYGQLLAAGDGFALHLWDVASGQKLAEQRAGVWWSLAFSPDGKRLAGGGSGLTVWRLHREPGRIDVGSPLALEVDAQVTKGETYALCFSHNGNKLAWVENGRPGVILRDIPRACPISVLPAKTAGLAPIITFNPDGHLVLITPAQEAEVWDVNVGKKVYSFGGGRLPPGAPGIRTKNALSANGRHFAWQGGGVTVWDMESRKLLVALPEDDSKVWALALSPDGDRLAVGLSDGSLAIWHLSQVQHQLAALGLGW